MRSPESRREPAFLRAPRCGAHNRHGGLCGCPAMRNGRCRLHGGLSTGARTIEGRERSRQAVLKHGFFTVEAIQARRSDRAAMRQILGDLRQLIRLAAGHDDHRDN